MSQLDKVTEVKDYVEGLVLQASGLVAIRPKFGEMESGKKALKVSLRPMH